MNKIKIVGILVFVLSLILALISIDISNKNRTNIRKLNILTEQKALIEKISKSIFYTYRNGVTGSNILDNGVQNIKIEENNIPIIQELWSSFYSDVKKFRTQHKIATGYNPVITAKLVNRIYHNNVLLVREFDTLIKVKKSNTEISIESDKVLQNSLFFILLTLLFYLFTQLHFVIGFIQKFSNSSKKIIKNSTIQGVKPIEIAPNIHELKEITDNYNFMVKTMNLSIENSTISMNQSIKSLENVAKNIENFMELISTMQEKETDELFEKEDAVIDSLETLMSLRKRLKDLKIDLDKLL
jgi:hypothetical protein